MPRRLPPSNVALGVVPGYDRHPLPDLLAAGIAVSLGSDCPLFFRRSVADEYALVAEHLGLTAAQLADIAASSLRHSCCPPDRLARALTALDDWRAVYGAPPASAVD